jgi:hypothetical protein
MVGPVLLGSLRNQFFVNHVGDPAREFDFISGNLAFVYYPNLLTLIHLHFHKRDFVTIDFAILDSRLRLLSSNIPQCLSS